jgi:glycine/D-amino acid oxidase-like deaminating enzyme/nitrite reductase/ring-hydroxylating ferredoxin subunit
MTSLWLSDRIESPTSAAAFDDADYDVVVVGAGITGLTTAVLLARAGKHVAVLEARYVGAGATGNTTGKISLLQGTKLSRIAHKHGKDVLRGYVAGNTEGRDWLLRYCEERGLSVQREDAYSYAQSAAGVKDANAELAACHDAGLHAEWASEADVPFPFHGGVRLRQQAQLDPMPLLSSLVTELETHGGRLFQGLRAESVSGLKRLTITVRPHRSAENPEPQRLSLITDQIVLATGTPILDRGGFVAKVTPQRSYCLAFDVPGDLTDAMFISVDPPTRSVRYAPTAAGNKLIVGGAGHTVGRSDGASGSIDELRRWTVLHHPGAVQTHFWSAQDYHPIDELPYVGPLVPGSDKICVATGFDKWGMTNGVAAALALAAGILGGRMDWAQAFASWSPPELTGIPAAVQANLEVGFNLAKGWITPVTAHAATLTEGQGVVSGPPWRLQATSLVDGTRRTTSPVCPHLGGIVTWKDADEAWECPLHGSRFDADGEVLEGPATRGLSHRHE